MLLHLLFFLLHTFSILSDAPLCLYSLSTRLLGVFFFSCFPVNCLLVRDNGRTTDFFYFFVCFQIYCILRWSYASLLCKKQLGGTRLISHKFAMNIDRKRDEFCLSKGCINNTYCPLHFHSAIYMFKVRKLKGKYHFLLVIIGPLQFFFSLLCSHLFLSIYLSLISNV